MPDLQALLINATVITALVGAIAAGAKIWHASSERRRLAMNALFAELAHVTRHYAISAAELYNPANTESVIRRLRWAKYGAVSGSSNLKELAILGPQQMAEFLQLSFVIRNTDILVDELLTTGTVPTHSQIGALTDRMADVAIHASDLTRYIQENATGLAPIKWD